MADLPNPLHLIPGLAPAGDRPDDAPDAGTPTGTAPIKGQLNIGGRHGSPSVVVGMPFSKVDVTEVDPLLRPAVLELAAITAALADAVGELAHLAGDEPALGSVRTAAVELRDRAGALAEQLTAPDRTT